MPELYFIKKSNWFISIWSIEESIAFFGSAVENEIYHQLKEKFVHENRLTEKLLPHYILKKADIPHRLNNLERKPVLEKGFVSISHSKSLLAVYYHESNAIGVDVEHIGARIMRITHKFLNTNERMLFESSPIKCLIVWAIKEAIFKKHGGGTAFFAENINVNEFEIQENPIPINAFVSFNDIVITEKTMCEIFDEFVLVYTV